MENSWQPYLKSMDDVWSNHTDRAERRRAQNRLAQRAKRKRKSRAQVAKGNLSDQQSAGQQDIPGSGEYEEISIDNQPETQSLLQTPTTAEIPRLEQVSSHNQENFLPPFNSNTSTHTQPSDPSSDTHFMILTSCRSHEAFSRIHTILQLKCSYALAIHVPPFVQPPASLVPTQEQLTIPHMMAIDLLPWKELRSNLTLATDVIDYEEFILDMTSDQLKVWGSTPWDPMGWEVGENFVRKWWVFMDESILYTTNFWRRQRNEKPLEFPTV
ncbi:hypothetical protein BGW36DRAFT_375317 [Talaromyces proteolyticus]|uniref:BZIP domain-containing protein n=1 Tax=Talaromyces proteolyticus TaxID=1131652 RepID=A0AAD4KXF0_9EURO|nr:uncharacterized protein BGW36DRAFT_375317 [Talaromyces proteolyticus]KAH8700967.1 hypothetical protein BGW36DRAFT_375317 [Talaromyces proteolyticus]